MTKERDKSLDVAKGILIILMVLGHCDGSGYFLHFVSLFHMACFVFISGCLYKEVKATTLKEFILNIIKRIKKLYLFYLRWELIFFVLTNLFLHIGFYKTGVLYGGKYIEPIAFNLSFVKSILGILICMGREPFCGAFWFIISLIFIIIIFSLIDYICVKTKRSELIRFALVFSLFVIGVTMSYIDIINIKRFSPALSLLIFYYLGYMNKRFNFVKFKKNILFLISFGCLLFLYFIEKENIGVNNNNLINPIYYILASSTGIYFIMFISNCLQNSKSLNYIGKNTLPIIALHLISFKFVMIIQYLLGVIGIKDLYHFYTASNNLWLVLYVICGVGIPLMINHIFALMKRTGGKL